MVGGGRGAGAALLIRLRHMWILWLKEGKRAPYHDPGLHAIARSCLHGCAPNLARGSCEGFVAWL